jgi:hypothetical protein
MLTQGFAWRFPKMRIARQSWTSTANGLGEPDKSDAKMIARPAPALNSFK